VTAQDDCQHWCDWSGKIRNSMIRLFHDRAIWRTILAMLHASPGVAPAASASTGWDRYTSSILTGIRRETGADDGRIGILCSLADLPLWSAAIATIGPCRPSPPVSAPSRPPGSAGQQGLGRV
jgi:hypothetical protein